MASNSTARPWSAEHGCEIIARRYGQEGALLPILHDIQHEFGWVPDEAVVQAALALNLSRAEVHGVLTFYPDLRRAPAARKVVKLCQAEACQARGGRAVTAAAEAAIGARLGATTPDGAVTLEPVYCLGLCASGPSALVNGRPIGRLDPAGVRRLLETGG